jgi:hypothetical protein
MMALPAMLSVTCTITRSKLLTDHRLPQELSSSTGTPNFMETNCKPGSKEVPLCRLMSILRSDEQEQPNNLTMGLCEDGGWTSEISRITQRRIEIHNELKCRGRGRGGIISHSKKTHPGKLGLKLSSTRRNQIRFRADLSAPPDRQGRAATGVERGAAPGGSGEGTAALRE